MFALVDLDRKQIVSIVTAKTLGTAALQSFQQQDRNIFIFYEAALNL